MAKLFPFPTLFILSALVIIRCNCSTYIVGDSSGWDISSNLDTWASSKRFFVGDVLLFQYSSAHSVKEVNNKESYDGCNTTGASSTGGNTTITLSKPGTRYFVCGNRLHCLGGMKLQVNVDSSGAPSSDPPARAPQAAPGAGGSPPPEASFPRPSTKSNNNPSVTFPTSAAAARYVYNSIGSGSNVLVLLSFPAAMYLIRHS